MKRGDHIEHNGLLFELYRIIPESQVGDDIDGLKAKIKMWHCDRSFKSSGKYYIVRDITDVEFEEIKT